MGFKHVFYVCLNCNETWTYTALFLLVQYLLPHQAWLFSTDQFILLFIQYWWSLMGTGFAVFINYNEVSRWSPQNFNLPLGNFCSCIIMLICSSLVNLTHTKYSSTPIRNHTIRIFCNSYSKLISRTPFICIIDYGEN